jgi:hypothetical protein
MLPASWRHVRHLRPRLAPSIPIAASVLVEITTPDCRSASVPIAHLPFRMRFSAFLLTVPVVLSDTDMDELISRLSDGSGLDDVGAERRYSRRTNIGDI